MNQKSHAKINLTLDVLKKSGSHHLIQTVFQQIDLHDLIIFTKNPESRKVLLRCSDPALPTNGKNTIIKAAKILIDYAKKNLPGKLSKNFCGLNIILKKNIPISAGLGGGSSNAAVTLIALNKIWKLNLSLKTLQKIAAKIGMDVPFFIKGGTALGTHYGEKIKDLPVLPNQYIIVVVNGRKKSTKEQYRELDLFEKKNPGALGKNNDLTKKLITSLKTGFKITPPQKTALCHNDFELINKPEICHLKKILLRSGAACVHTGGSGPALFALYKNRSQQSKAYNQLKNKFRFIWRSS